MDLICHIYTKEQIFISVGFRKVEGFH